MDDPFAGATCKTDPALWTEPRSRRRAEMAAAACRVSCPLLDECRKWSIKFRPTGVVQAGHYWPEHGVATSRGLPEWYRAAAGLGKRKEDAADASPPPVPAGPPEQPVLYAIA